MASMFPSPFVHDLALLSLSDTKVDAACLAEPDWIKDALEKCSWVVVRRSLAPKQRISIGVRGSERRQRWGGFVRYSQIVRVATPRELRSDLSAKNRLNLPAMRTLQFLESALSSFPLEWGPGGSVGYELASGTQVVHPKSDLDLVIRAPKRFARKVAKELSTILLASPGKIDCRIETPWCGFSLEEYARARTPSLIVRTPAGPRLSNDPWQDPSLPRDLRGSR
jgi:phosphoribosyl-dephospho-CoA transferase